MSAAALPQDALLPQAPGGMASGAAAALLVHAGLIAALTLGMDWRSREPDTVVAELWSAVPQAAAPPPPAPAVAAPPPPLAKPATQPDADIALERERRQKADQKKAEDDRKRLDAEAERKRQADEKKAQAERRKLEAAEAARVAEQKAEEQAEDERINKQRQENLRRMMAQAGSAPGATGQASVSAGPSASYLAKVRAAVLREIVFAGSVVNNASAEVSVTTAPGGTILSSRLQKSSGNKDYDAAVLRALEKLGALPRDTDGRVPPSFTLVFRQSD